MFFYGEHSGNYLIRVMVNLILVAEAQ